MPATNDMSLDADHIDEGLYRCERRGAVSVCMLTNATL